MSKSIGLITIGQSPRSDMTHEMQPLLGSGVVFDEIGALDDLSEKDISELSPEQGELTYVSRLRNGKSAKLSKVKLEPYLQKKVQEIEQRVSSSILVCTGSFPTIVHEKPILFPDQVLKNVVKSVIGDGKLGLMIPLEEQRDQLTKKWEGTPLEVAVSSPYEGADFESVGNELLKKGVTLIVLDCMGYTEEQKRRVKSSTGLPVILSRSIVSRVAAELV